MVASSKKFRPLYPEPMEGQVQVYDYVLLCVVCVGFETVCPVDVSV